MQLTEQMKNPHKWAALIRKHRLRSHLSRKAFGAMFGVSSTSVGHWECDRYAPNPQATWWVMEQELAMVMATATKRRKVAVNGQ